ncbi:MAG TPA: cytochrome P450 [Sphingobium sp.]
MQDKSVIAERPAHIPPQAVYDFDMFRDPGLIVNPHDRVKELLRDAPEVFWTPHNGGHWLIVSHAANFEASRDPSRFSSVITTEEDSMAFMTALGDNARRIPAPFPIGLDPPMHEKYRAPLQKVFAPKVIMALKKDIEQLADQLVLAVADKGRCEFIKDISEPLPVIVFLRMLGMPVDRMQEFRAIIHEFFAPPVGPLDMARRIWKVIDAMKDTMLARREQPQDDIISLLWQTEIDGRPMTYEDMENYGLVLFTAGLDTVVNGMAHGARHLALNPDLQRQLREKPSLIVEAAEEILRRYTFTVPPRVVAQDQEFFGCPMKKGESVSLFLPGADLDERAFKNAGEFDLGREDKVHIAFGAGPHRCLGSHLARVELQVLYDRLLARLPEFRMDPEQPPRFHGGPVIGFDHLHLLWDA